MYCSDVSSMSTPAPSRSTTMSSSWRAASTSKAYWKPEQPPPWTEIRSIEPGASVFMISEMRFAARGVSSIPAIVSSILVPATLPSRTPRM